MATIRKQDQIILGRIVIDAALRYYAAKAHRKAFERWYSAKYGKPYVWPQDEGEYGTT